MKVPTHASEPDTHGFRLAEWDWIPTPAVFCCGTGYPHGRDLVPTRRDCQRTRYPQRGPGLRDQIPTRAASLVCSAARQGPDFHGRFDGRRSLQPAKCRPTCDICQRPAHAWVFGPRRWKSVAVVGAVGCGEPIRLRAAPPADPAGKRVGIWSPNPLGERVCGVTRKGTTEASVGIWSPGRQPGTSSVSGSTRVVVNAVWVSGPPRRNVSLPGWRSRLVSPVLDEAWSARRGAWRAEESGTRELAPRVRRDTRS